MWHSFGSGSESVAAIVGRVSSILNTAVQSRGEAGLAVSGGRSPIPLFEALSGADLPWPRITISLVDERFVPPTHEDSNEHLVRNHLLKGRAGQASFIGLATDMDSIESSVTRANRYTSHIDVTILGMGEDGHTASLFPGARQLADALNPRQTQRYLHVTPPTAPHERITLSLAALLKVGQLVLTVSGPHKKAVLKRAQQATTPLLPISYLLSPTAVPLDVYWHD